MEGKKFTPEFINTTMRLLHDGLAEVYEEFFDWQGEIICDDNIEGVQNALLEQRNRIDDVIDQINPNAEQ